MRDGTPFLVDLYCLIQYTTASRLLLQSVEELKQASVEMETYNRRLERLETHCKELDTLSAKKAELKKVESDSRRLYVRRRKGAYPAPLGLTLTLFRTKCASPM